MSAGADERGSRAPARERGSMFGYASVRERGSMFCFCICGSVDKAADKAAEKVAVTAREAITRWMVSWGF